MSVDPHCDVCGQKATVFVTLVKNGQEISLSFCQKHAEVAGVFNTKAYGLVGAQEPADKPLSRLVVCTHCGFTHHDFNKLGRFGCAHCYEAFKKELKPVLKRVQAGMVHVGKSPSKFLNIRALKNRLHSLDTELSRAIQEEHYEEAAHFRDEMAEIRALLEAQEQSNMRAT